MLNNVLAPDQLYGISQQAVINGNFDVWQRGTSFTNPVSTTYTADKWNLRINNAGTLPTTILHRQVALVPNANDLSGIYYYNINVNGAGSGFGISDYYHIQSRIENGTRLLCGLGRKVTVSFYARSSIAGKKLGYSVYQVYGTGGSPSAAEIIKGDVITLTSTFTKYTVTFTTNTLSGKTFGTNPDDYLAINIFNMWGTSTATTQFNTYSSAETFVGSGDVDISQVKVNAGDSALAFQPKSIVQETSDSQRYAIAYTNSNTSFPIGNGFALSTTQARIQVELPTSMRIAPSLTATATDWQISDGVTATDLTAISIVSGQSSNKTVTLLCTVASGLTQFRPYQLIADGTADRLMIFDAEL